MCIRDREKTDHTGTKKAALEEAVANYENTDYKAVSYTHLDVYKRQELD